jgi:anionic cell wall polymer biosynthesis LytR-Cps2A-Psr (LCP) family protein
MHYSRSYLLQKPKKTSKRKRKMLFFLIALMLLILAVVFSVNLITIFNSMHNDADWAQALRLQRGGDERVYILYGIDYWGANPYVERMLLVHHHTLNRSISLLYIPGNTLIETEERGPEPLGQAYRHLEPPAFIELVQELTGIAVHHYMALNYQGIIVLGDYLGGVESGALLGEGESAGSLLPRENGRLSGFELYRYFLTADYREPPWEQLNRQQQVLAQFWNIMQSKKIWHWPKMIKTLSPFLETDLSWRELTALRDQFEEYEYAEMKALILPGKEEVIDGCLYWVPDQESLEDIVRLINEGYLVIPSEVKIEVLNGSGIDGLASEVAALLEQEGFQVVRKGNADHFDYKESQVIALGEIVDKARAVALYIPGSSMLHRYDPEAEVDVTVIIGSNYSEYRNNH